MYLFRPLFSTFSMGRPGSRSGASARPTSITHRKYRRDELPTAGKIDPDQLVESQLAAVQEYALRYVEVDQKFTRQIAGLPADLEERRAINEKIVIRAPEFGLSVSIMPMHGEFTFVRTK